MHPGLAADIYMYDRYMPVCDEFAYERAFATAPIWFRAASQPLVPTTGRTYAEFGPLRSAAILRTDRSAGAHGISWPQAQPVASQSCIAAWAEIAYDAAKYGDFMLGREAIEVSCKGL